MDKKNLIASLLAIVFLITFLAAPAHADTLYNSVYKLDSGEHMNATYFNTNWESIDLRLDALEDVSESENPYLIFKTFAVSGQDDVVADSATDTLTFVEGDNITITTSADTITITASTTPTDILNGGVEVVDGATDVDFDANFTVTDEGGNEAGVALVDDPVIAGYLSVTEQIDFTEMTAPGNPTANHGALYVADSGGTTTLYFKDSAGTATNLLSAGSDEAIQDIAGAMWTGNTETLITVTYQDADGTIDAVVTNDLGDAGWDWSNVVDADITNTLTASIFVGSGSTTNAVDLATAEVAGTLQATNIVDVYIRNDQSDSTTGSITLNDGIGDSPLVRWMDGDGYLAYIYKADSGNAVFYNTEAGLALYLSGDTDDRMLFQTVSNEPVITTVGSCDLVLTSSNSAVRATGTLTGSSTISADDGDGDSPEINCTDGDNKKLYLVKLDAGAGVIGNNEGAINVISNNDTDDYMVFSTTSNEPYITTGGGCDLVLSSDSGNIDVATTLTVTGIVYSAVGFDGVGAVDLDYGSADITDHTFTTNDCTVIIDGGITVSTGDTITLGSTVWNTADTINGESIGDDTIDDDSIDFADVTGADLTLTDCGAITSTGTITATVGFDIVGAADMDYGSADVTDHTFVTDGTGDGEIVLPNDSIGSAEMAVDTFAELQTHIADKTLLNAEDASTIVNTFILDDGFADSPALQFIDQDNKVFQIHKDDDGGAVLQNNEGSIGLLPSNDTDDFWSFTTVSNVPTVAADGGNDLKIDDNLTITGNLTVDGNYNNFTATAATTVYFATVTGDTGFDADIHTTHTATSLTYDGDTGENCINISAGKVRLYNVTQSEYRWVTACNVATNTITTDSSTDGWTENDVITTDDPLCAADYLAINISSVVPATASMVLLNVFVKDNGNIGTSKVVAASYATTPLTVFTSRTQVADIILQSQCSVQTNSAQKIAIKSETSATAKYILIQLVGYWR